MDVPESMLYATPLRGTDDTGDHAARMSIAGADRSGCNVHTNARSREPNPIIDHLKLYC